MEKSLSKYWRKKARIHYISEKSKQKSKRVFTLLFQKMNVPPIFFSIYDDTTKWDCSDCCYPMLASEMHNQ